MIFNDGYKVLGTATITGGIASLNMSNLAVGSHNVMAIYSGDANDAGSISNTVAQTVEQSQYYSHSQLFS